MGYRDVLNEIKSRLNTLKNKMFKKKISVGLPLPVDLETIPGREIFEEMPEETPEERQKREELLKLLEQYKDNYMETLTQKKYFISQDLSSTDYREDMLMNFNILGMLALQRIDNYNFDVMEESEKEKLWLYFNTMPKKLELYKTIIDKMYKETHLKLIALMEIYQEFGEKLSKNKLDAILEELYNLKVSYFIFKRNSLSSAREIENYKKDANYHNYLENYSEAKRQLLIEQRKKELYELASVVMPQVFQAIVDMNLDDLKVIATIERELEIYAYQHKNDLDKFNTSLEELDKIPKTLQDRDMLLENIKELEVNFRILNEFGGGKLDLKALYEIKFDILTINIVGQNDSPFREITNLEELKYYEDILANRLSIYVTGTDSLIIHRYENDPEGAKNIVKNIQTLLKDNDKYDFREILQNRFKLALILACGTEYEMEMFFRNYKVDLNHEGNNFSVSYYENDSGLLRLEDVVPLSTVCRINIMADKAGHMKYQNKERSLAAIYEYVTPDDYSGVYKLPEGITRFIANSLQLSSEDEAREYFLSKASDKVFITPRTLKWLNLSDIFKDVQIQTIILNEGLRYIDGFFPFYCNTLKSIAIPSTLECINIASDNTDNSTKVLEAIDFTKFEDSLILHNEENLRELIKVLVDKFDSELRIASGLIKGEIYRPFLERIKITLYSKSGERIEIKLYDIYKKWDYDVYKNCNWKDSFCDEVIKTIYNVIQQNEKEKGK